MPTVCILCRTPAYQPYDLCLPCWQNLPILTHSCRLCANSLPHTPSENLCGECIQKNPPFERTHALFLYQPPIPKLILDLKFHHHFANANLLGELLAKKIREEWYQTAALPTAIIPIPLHPNRLRERGFNQAVEIARPIAKRLHLPLLTREFIRHKATVPQASLQADQRKQNMLNAFSTRQFLKNQHVAVVDDVITTGNTIREFCRLLKKQGAGKISVWCCARAYFK